MRISQLHPVFFAIMKRPINHCLPSDVPKVCLPAIGLFGLPFAGLPLHRLRRTVSNVCEFLNLHTLYIFLVRVFSFCYRHFIRYSCPGWCLKELLLLSFYLLAWRPLHCCVSIRCFWCCGFRDLDLSPECILLLTGVICECMLEDRGADAGSLVIILYPYQ